MINKVNVRLDDLIPDVPNRVGLIFSAECLEDIVNQINQGKTLLTSGISMDGYCNISDGYGIVSNAVLTKTGIWVDITRICGLPFHTSIFDFLVAGYPAYCDISGTCDKDKKITSVTLISVYPGPAKRNTL